MKTLEHWFLPNSNFDISRNKFYLEWKYGSHRPSKIEWVKTIPSNCNITKKLLFKVDYLLLYVVIYIIVLIQNLFKIWILIFNIKTNLYLSPIYKNVLDYN